MKLPRTRQFEKLDQGTSAWRTIVISVLGLLAGNDRSPPKFLTPGNCQVLSH